MEKKAQRTDLSYIGCIKIISKAVPNLQIRAKILAYVAHPEMNMSNIESLLENIKKTPEVDDFTHNTLAQAIVNLHHLCFDDNVGRQVYEIIIDLMSKRVVAPGQPIFRQILDYYANPSKSVNARKAAKVDFELDV